MADILTKLSSKYKCDKSDRRHKYTQKYHRYFGHMRNQDFNMLEFGFGQGKSVKMWLEYFTKAKLFTVDVRKELPKDKLIQKYVREGRFVFISADQIDLAKIIPVVNREKKFQLIIDDASHVAEDQQYTMVQMFCFLASDGYYVIEDLKCKRSPSKRFECEGEKTLKVLNNYLKTGFFESKILDFKENSYLTQQISNIEIYDKIAFIQKRGIYGY